MNHDSSYKLLFSHAEMVEDLLRGFVREAWVEQLDFTSLEKLNASYIGDDLRDRADDVVWRVRLRDQWLYIYLLLEFQSTVDPWMALRVLVYVGLLYQDLIRARQLTPNKRLPPVLPIVLYNGEPRWYAPEEVNALIEPAPAGLEAYQPRLRYLLLDEGRYAPHELEELRNLAAALFRLEQSRAPEDIRRVLKALIAWLKVPEQRSLRRAFTVWLKRILLPARVPGVDFSEIHDLQEAETMLAERVKKWAEEWKEQGLEEGRQEGRQEGQAALLLQMLEWKFGTPDAETRARVETAAIETVLCWSRRLLEARSLDEVFGHPEG
jgi:predicted transposase/invertase (TIGR01784 family)